MAGNISSRDTCWVITLVMKIKICMQRLQKYHKDNLLFQFIQIMFPSNDYDKIYIHIFNGFISRPTPFLESIIWTLKKMVNLVKS